MTDGVHSFSAPYTSDSSLVQIPVHYCLSLFDMNIENISGRFGFNIVIEDIIFDENSVSFNYTVHSATWTITNLRYNYMVLEKKLSTERQFYIESIQVRFNYLVETGSSKTIGSQSTRSIWLSTFSSLSEDFREHSWGPSMHLKTSIYSLLCRSVYSWTYVDVIPNRLS